MASPSQRTWQAAPPRAVALQPTYWLRSTRTRLAVAAWPRLSAEQWLLVGIVLTALLAHAINMFDFLPTASKDDEGIYTAQAWAVLREQRLTPYTYWYDHAPAGWLLLAVWMALTGGPLAFGQALDSGRVLMLLTHVASVALLYRAARKLGCGPGAAGVGSLLFAVSPLAVFYGRLILLDNLMVFWLLLSLDLLLDAERRLSRYVISGLCFGMACLTKETAVVVVPAFLGLVLHQREKRHGHFGAASWLAPMLAILSWYPLYAALKNELLPAGQSILFAVQGTTSGGVSLTEALKWQAARGGGGILNFDNQFWQLVRGDWLPRDSILLLGGGLAALVNLITGVIPGRLRSRTGLIVGLLGVLPLAYLGRGGVVFDFYILFAIPFLCLNLAFVFGRLQSWTRARLGQSLAIVLASALLAGYWEAHTPQPLYTQQPGLAGREAIPWIKQHAAAESRIITPDDFWTDLHEAGPAGPAFPAAHSHWKVAADPAVRSGVFGDDWHNVDFLIMAPGVQESFVTSNDQVALDALANAHQVKEWQSDGASVSLWKVDHAGATEANVLAETRASIVDRFERARQGAYVGSDGSVFSETEAYALLRDVWSDDRVDFMRTWGWMDDHLVQANGLPVWLWRYGSVVDAHTASDADADTALALLMAGQRWHDPALVDAGRTMVRAIWNNEVVSVAGKPLLTAGDWSANATDGVVAFNPSYFAPYAYRVFRDVDPEHDWSGVIDSGYATLFAASQATLGGTRSSGLPPDWVGVNRTTGDLTPLAVNGKTDTTGYGYDAPRTYWRIALDRAWSGDGRAEAYLGLSNFLRDEVARKGAPSAAYAHDGTVLIDPSSTVGVAGALAALSTLDAPAGHALFASQILGTLQVDPVSGSAWWGNRDDVYGQAWGWFATALSANSLPDLWHAS